MRTGADPGPPPPPLWVLPHPPLIARGLNKSRFETKSAPAVWFRGPSGSEAPMHATNRAIQTPPKPRIGPRTIATPPRLAPVLVVLDRSPACRVPFTRAEFEAALAAWVRLRQAQARRMNFPTLVPQSDVEAWRREHDRLTHTEAQATIEWDAVAARHPEAARAARHEPEHTDTTP
jgi:hypothetical protein